jgi:zinc transporter 1/2/3
MFEGLGLGARLAGLSLPKRLHWVPVAAAILFSAITPIGLAIGLGFRKTYSPTSPTALIVSGILDSLSAGVLLVSGCLV